MMYWHYLLQGLYLEQEGKRNVDSAFLHGALVRIFTIQMFMLAMRSGKKS